MDPLTGESAVVHGVPVPETPVMIGMRTLRTLATQIEDSSTTDPDLVARFQSLLETLDKTENRNVEFAERLVACEESVTTLRNALAAQGVIQPAGQRLQRDELPSGF